MKKEGERYIGRARGSSPRHPRGRRKVVSRRREEIQMTDLTTVSTVASTVPVLPTQPLQALDDLDPSNPFAQAGAWT